MRKAPPRMLDLSREFIACEGLARQSSGGSVTVADICEKLRPKLSTLMGATGYHAMLARALALATAEVPALASLEIDSAHRLVERNTTSTQKDGMADIEGGGELLAQLLGLLVAFIGEKLTRQILLEIWPQAFVNDSKFATGESA